MLSIRESNNTYFLEFTNRSVGITLFATESKNEAESELTKLQSMNRRQLKSYILLPFNER